MAGIKTPFYKGMSSSSNPLQKAPPPSVQLSAPRVSRETGLSGDASSNENSAADQVVSKKFPLTRLPQEVLDTTLELLPHVSVGALLKAANSKKILFSHAVRQALTSRVPTTVADFDMGAGSQLIAHANDAVRKEVNALLREGDYIPQLSKGEDIKKAFSLAQEWGLATSALFERQRDAALKRSRECAAFDQIELSEINLQWAEMLTLEGKLTPLTAEPYRVFRDSAADYALLQASEGYSRTAASYLRHAEETARRGGAEPIAKEKYRAFRDALADYGLREAKEGHNSASDLRVAEKIAQESGVEPIAKETYQKIRDTLVGHAL